MDEKTVRKAMTPDQIAGWINFWGIIAFIATVTGTFALYMVNSVLPVKLKEAELQIEQELIAKGPYHWPNRLLEKNSDWVEVAYAGPEAYRLFIEKSGIPINETRATQILLRDGEQTILWAEKHVLGSNYRWISSQHEEISDSPIQHGDFQVSVRRAVEGTALAKVVRGAATEDEIDIIGIGLESHPGDDTDPRRQLSRHRGLDLAVAAGALIDTVSLQRKPSFRALGLGKARTLAVRGTAEEQNQRRLVIFVTARKRSALNDVQTIETLVVGVPHDDIDLADYEYAECAGQVLSPPINFEGGGNSDWFDSGPTVEQLC